MEQPTNSDKIVMLSFMTLSVDLITMSDKKGRYVLLCKVLSKPSLHREVVVVPRPERYGKRYNGFDVAEGFPLEQTYH